ncbi:hypothetical protein BC628DRAFT_593202 [Trametes gibbosa]|nr:hypothetical protein BC628DRAFT_593202 [Trametes gibbosa]
MRRKPVLKGDDPQAEKIVNGKCLPDTGAESPLPIVARAMVPGKLWQGQGELTSSRAGSGVCTRQSAKSAKRSGGMIQIDKTASTSVRHRMIVNREAPADCRPVRWYKASQGSVYSIDLQKVKMKWGPISCTAYRENESAEEGKMHVFSSSAQRSRQRPPKSLQKIPDSTETSRS